jgi:DMSO/TMAO reductase YedYZ molybdopterin-dependent catalytic subunit
LQQHDIKSFLIGSVAGALALALSFLLRKFVAGVFLPELAAQTLFSLVPGQFESEAVENLGSLAKYTAFAGAITTNVLFYGIIGVMFYRIYDRLPLHNFLLKAIQVSLASYLVFLTLGEILLMSTVIATEPMTFPQLALFLLPPNLVFGLVLSFLRRSVVLPEIVICKETTLEKRVTNYKKRLFIKTSIAAGVASIILFYGLDLLFQKSSNPSSLSENRAVFYQSEVTPNNKFYRVDVNIDTPAVDVNRWNLAVGGLVSNPLTLSYQDLKSLPAVEQYNTLECISNKVGGDLISTAKWKGVRLSDILNRAQVRSEAVYLVFGCYDGYDVGIPLERAMADETILAYEMNGDPLPPEHGYPVRVIVPGLYGMMNAKWVTKIELVNKVYEGFWQKRGWTNDAKYQTGSTIVIPGDSPLQKRFGFSASSDVLLGGKIPIAGIAFAGNRGIAKVEVSTDGGNVWETASLKDPLSDNTWVLWATEWNPPARGEYKIMVRAIDKTGKVQTMELNNPFPNGSTGYHVVNVKVLAPG